MCQEYLSETFEPVPLDISSYNLLLDVLVFAKRNKLFVLLKVGSVLYRVY